MIDVKKLLAKILSCSYTDGTDNSWTYKRYTNGTYEAWRTITLSIARQTSYGSLYRSLEQSVTLPSFNSGTNYQLIGSSNGGDWLLFNTFNETTASYFFIRTSSAAAANKVARLYIHGTCK